MLITHFNKLIRNKIVWGVFAGLVCIAWLGFDTSTGGCGANNSDQGGVEGKLFGKAVTPQEFFQARYYEMGLREQRDTSEEAEQTLRKRTWARLAAVRVATDMGISVSDVEVRETIQKDPAFQNNGVFSPDRYQAFISQQLRIPIQTFEDYLRQELLLQKLSGTLQAQVWTAPSELSNRLDDLTDTMAAEYVFVTNAVKVAAISDEQARAFFEANRSLFTIPEKVSVRYVAFPVSNFLAKATVDEAAARNYYEENIGQFSVTDTNGVTTAKPMDDVREEITRLLKQREATFLARDAATELAVVLAPDRAGKAATLAQAAADRGLVVQTTGWFALDEAVPGITAAPADFNATAFKLDKNDAMGYFSDALSSDESAYILAAEGRQDSREPAFEEVRGAVLPKAQEKAERDAFEKHVADVRTALAAAVAAGTNFVDAAALYRLNVTTTGVFSVYEGLDPSQPHGRDVVGAVAGQRKGDVCQPVYVEGGALLVHVARREAGNTASREMLRPQILASLDRYRAGMMYVDWADYLLAKAKLEDLRPIGGKVDETPEEAPVRPQSDPGL